MGGGSKTEGKVDYGKRKPDEEKRIEMLVDLMDSCCSSVVDRIPRNYKVLGFNSIGIQL